LIPGVVFFIALFLFEEATRYYLERHGGNTPTPGLKEFPEIEEAALSKFTSFDPELGWERQPNQERKTDVGGPKPDDPDADKVLFSTDEYGSRVCDVPREESEFTVATYGDSFCACRGVGDRESFQHYLSQALDVHVSNYGVGNYGLDQALLRLKRRFDDDPADYVVFASSEQVTMNRLLNVWKHYFEFGNTFAIKPRFELKDGELELVPTPIRERSDLLDIESHRDFLRSNDFHYENWFLSHSIRRPYSRYWFQSPWNVPYAAATVLEYATRNRPLLKPLHTQAYAAMTTWAPKTKDRNIQTYRHHLERDFSDLFCAILKEFAEFVRSRGAVPIYLPIRSQNPAGYGDREPLGDSIKEQLARECPELNVVDPRADIDRRVDSEEFYVGHPGPKHNQWNAEALAAFICEREAESGTRSVATDQSVGPRAAKRTSKS
jgi:uncharacterized protein YutD